MIEKIIKGIKYCLDEENLTAKVIQKKGYEGDIIIPEAVVLKKVAYRVTSIGSRAFAGCKSLTSIVIPDGVTSIGEWAFANCDYITSIVIPDSVTGIGEGAFNECHFLTSIVIPDGVTSIEDFAFSCCDSLTSIVIGNGVTSIGDRAFDGCESLTSIVIPDGVRSIGERAFYNCSFTSIVIPDSVTSIGREAFEYCFSLQQKPTQEIEMSNIKYRLLMHNHLAMVLGYSGRSATINIPSEINHEGVIYRVASIWEEAFADCSSLTSVVIGNSVTSIGESAFQDCSSLTSITFNGTKAQWKGINLGEDWNDAVPTNVIHCTDGEVEI